MNDGFATGAGLVGEVAGAGFCIGGVAIDVSTAVLPSDAPTAGAGG